jgi:hypothetical protein
VEVGTNTVAQPETASAHHLNNGATIKHSGDKHNGARLRRRHRERFGVLLGEGYFAGDAVMVTLTMDEETAASPEKAAKWNSVITAINARGRRAGVTGRVTASERGEQTGRPHRHMVWDVGINALWQYGLKHWRGFRKFARDFEPDDGAMKAMELQNRWETGRWRGKRRPEKARTYQELVLSRYLGQGSIGWVDVLDITGTAAVGYALKYTSKGGGRVSYSRSASIGWAHHAKILVYAYNGESMRYPPRDPDWVRNEVGRLDRRDARRRHDQLSLRASAIPSMLSAMARYEEYIAMTTAASLHFRASKIHSINAAAIRYRLEEIENPDMEREAITGEDEAGL